jgi:hypothetical protein
MKIQARKDIARIIREDRQAIDGALAKGVRDAVLRHKKDDIPVVIDRDGKIELVKPEDLGF